jgi:hypothetical protein
VAVLEQANSQTQHLEVRQIPLMVLARILWLLGWLAGKAWLATTWVGVAILIGWTDSRERPRRR